MNNEVIDQWIAELRSGKHKQGRRFLHNAADDSKCCLGVLCGMAVEAGIIPPPTKVTLPAEEIHAYCMDPEAEAHIYEYDGEDGVVSENVKAWIGLRFCNGSTYDGTLTLSDRNDKGDDFDTIANLIEQNKERLFHE